MDSAPGPATDVVDPRRVALRAGVVFKADYDAAPKGDKSRTVDRLRHALVYAQTQGEHISTKSVDPLTLLQVWQRLTDIAEGRLLYELEPDVGVTWVMQTGKRVTVTWADLEGEPEPEDGAA